MDQELRCRHVPAECAVRRTPQPDAGSSWPRDVAGMARGEARRCASAQGHACTLPVRRDEVLADQHPRRERQKQ